LNLAISSSSALIEAYLTHLTVERRLASNSVESYARDLGLLAAFAAGQGRPVEGLGRPELEGLVRNLMSEGRAPRSVARAVACVRGFYRFLVVDGRLQASPADDLHPPRAWKVLPRYLSVEDVDRLISQPDISTPRGLRDRALIELLYATGMRVSELLTLRPANVNVGASYLTCTGKGDKERIVPFGDEAGSWVSRYLREARPVLLGRRNSPRLFVNARGGGFGLTRIGFWKILKTYARQAARYQHPAPPPPSPASPAALVRDAPARGWRRSAHDPGAAGALVALDHPGLQPCRRAPSTQGLRLLPPPLIEGERGVRAAAGNRERP